MIDYTSSIVSGNILSKTKPNTAPMAKMPTVMSSELMIIVISVLF